MEYYTKQRAVIKGAITKLETFVLSNINVLNIDVSEYVAREIFLQKKYEDYCNVQTKIEKLAEDESEKGDEVELKYFSVCSKIKKN